MADLTQLGRAPAPGSEEWRELMSAAKRKRKGQKEEEFSPYVLSRPELHNVALFGVLRDMVDAACANSEAVRPTVAIHILARFAATIGRTAYIQIGDERRYLRMNALIVGPTAKGRKGTSAQSPMSCSERLNCSPSPKERCSRRSFAS